MTSGVSHTAQTCTYTLSNHEVSIPFHCPQFDRTIRSTWCKGTYRIFLLLHCIRMKDYSSYIATMSSQSQHEVTVGHRPHLTQPTPTTKTEAKELNFHEARYWPCSYFINCWGYTVSNKIWPRNYEQFRETGSHIQTSVLLSKEAWEVATNGISYSNNWHVVAWNVSLRTTKTC